MEECLLPYPSAHEINYLAFSRPTIGYFCKLYGCLNQKLATREGEQYVNLETMEKFFEKEGYKKCKEVGGRDSETIFTYRRNAVCHPENKARFYEEKGLREETEALRKILKNWDTETKTTKNHPDSVAEIIRET